MVKNKSVNEDISADENEMMEELDTLREIQFAALEAAASDAEESEAVHDNVDIQAVPPVKQISAI